MSVKAQRNIKGPGTGGAKGPGTGGAEGGTRNHRVCLPLPLILKFSESSRLPGTVWKLRGAWRGRRKTGRMKKEECFSGRQLREGNCWGRYGCWGDSEAALVELCPGFRGGGHRSHILPCVLCCYLGGRQPLNLLCTGWFAKYP